MSFSHNPFRNLQLTMVDGSWRYHCSSCGDISDEPITTLHELTMYNEDHIRLSHKRTRANFDD